MDRVIQPEPVLQGQEAGCVEDAPQFHVLQPVQPISFQNILANEPQLTIEQPSRPQVQDGDEPDQCQEPQMQQNFILFNPHETLPGTTNNDGITNFFVTPLLTEDELQQGVLGRRNRKGMNSKTSLFKTRNAAMNPSLDLGCEWSSCDQRFDHMPLFMAHVGEHVKQHLAELVDDDDEELNCAWRLCDFFTQDRPEFQRHVHFHSFHTKIKYKGELMIKETKVNPCFLDEGQRNIVPDVVDAFNCCWEDCLEADTDFVEAQKYYWHVEQHAEVLRPLPGSKQTEPYQCQWSQCQSLFGSVSKLKEHLRTHTLERACGCPVCGGLFGSRSKFFDHCIRQSVADRNKFSCDYCKRGFCNERMLRDHMRSHVNQYKCRNCEYTSPSPSGLKNHMLYKHSTDRPFECSECDYKAKRERDLYQHQLLKHGPDDLHACPVVGCKVKSKNKTSLKLHLKKCHPEETSDMNPVSKYKCDTCHKLFVRGNYLTQHYRNIHGFQLANGQRAVFLTGDDGYLHIQTARFESAIMKEGIDTELVSNSSDF